MRIHQISPSISYGDATSNHIYEIDTRLRQWGYDSHIFVQSPPKKGSSNHHVHDFDELAQYLSNQEDLFIYHYGIYHHAVELFQKARGRKILIYHNITPAHFFAGWNSHSESSCNIGRTYLQCLTDCDFGIGDSDYNRRELVEVGFDAANTAVLPIFLTLNTFATVPIDQQLVDTLQQQTNWLTVGRVAPNKNLENVIRIFYVYQSYFNTNAHLHLVGSSNLPTYQTALNTLVAELGLTDHVTFAGKVSNAQLKTYYSYCDLYITASQHEGFCVPLIESMYFDLPILANQSSAIPETVGDAGVLFDNLGYEEVAAMAHLILTDQVLKQKILEGQKNRLPSFAPDHIEVILKDILSRFT